MWTRRIIQYIPGPERGERESVVCFSLPARDIPARKYAAPLSAEASRAFARPTAHSGRSGRICAHSRAEG